MPAVPRSLGSRARLRALPGRAGSALAALLLVTATLPAGLVTADSGLSSGQVADEIIRVQDEADALAQAYSAAEVRADDLHDQIAEAQAQVDATQAQLGGVTAQMARIAVTTFENAGSQALPFTGNPVDPLSVDVLRDVALDTGATSVDDLEATRTLFGIQQGKLAQLQQANANLISSLAASKDALDHKMTQLATLRDHLHDAEVKTAYDQKMAKLRAEKVAKEAAAAAAKAAAAAPTPRGAGAATATATAASTDGGATQTTEPSAAKAGIIAIAVPVNASFVCPVAGPNAFGDTFGAPRPGGRQHQGVDMISPFGTPLVAVVSGDAIFRPDPLGGNSISLKGDDGNGYYYAHLSSYQGPSPRHVQAGEVMGYVGHTGDTSVDHLHFEIHPNRGPAIDPTPTVRQYC